MRGLLAFEGSVIFETGGFTSLYHTDLRYKELCGFGTQRGDNLVLSKARETTAVLLMKRRKIETFIEICKWKQKKGRGRLGTL